MGVFDALRGPDAKVAERIATALERIADALEGQTPLQELPPEPDEIRETRVSDHEDLARMDTVALELSQLLGRDPTADELVHAVDGLEWDDDDVTARAKQ